MSGETQPGEVVERDIEPFSLVDGECHIGDLHDFYADHDALAVAFIAGDLLVLQKRTYQWVSITKLNPNKPGNVSAIGGTNGPRNARK